MATTSNAASDYLEQAALEFFFGYNSSYSSPTYLEIALYNSDPGDDGMGGTELDSINDPGYSRVTLSSPYSDITVNSNSSGGYEVAPSSTVTFTATGSWTSAPTYVAIFDNNSNMLCRMALDDGAGNSLSALTNGQSLELTSSNLLFKLS